MKKILMLVVAVGCFGTDGENEVDSDDNILEAINDINRQFMDCVSMGDPDLCSSLFTEDALYGAPNLPFAKGRPAIRDAWEKEIEAGMQSLQLMTDEVESFGVTAHEVGRYVVKGLDDIHLDHGKYIVLWKRTSEGWRAHREVFNSDMSLEPQS
jgi:ketosteroid isomerase-like protein|tara:strand:- start:6 stop:467 length:462 start_codon:yes stop_codon:yes gene_type:complete